MDTKLEAEGAEFLVLGQMLLQRIYTYKTYTNMPGYDLVATCPEMNRSARIQVKSRWRTGATGFLINNFECEYVVFVRLNRGTGNGAGQVLPPEYFVFPTPVVREGHRSDSWGKLYLRSIPDYEQYKDNWAQIADYLSKPA